MSDTTREKELQILETIHAAGQENKAVAQRDLAHIVGVSLGMTNAILRRLAKKGFLTIRKVNNRNIHYAVSPEGMKALSEKSYRYFKRTIKNVVYYKERIGAAVKDAADRDFTRVLLIGESDLDFIVEHFCMKHGVEFRRSPKSGVPAAADGDGTFLFVSENAAGPAAASGENVCFLRDIVY